MSNEWSPPQRREFLRSIAKTTLGGSFAGGLAFGRPDDALAARGGAARQAKHIIYLFMDGAMTHLDTFDPKTGVEQAGETKPIQTRLPGVQFGDRFPKLGYMADGLAVVRSLSTETGDHEKGRYLMRTGYKQLNSAQHPGMGAHMVDQKGRLNKQLPGNYLIGGGNRHPGAGFLDPSFSSVPIARAEAGLQNTELPKYLPTELFDRRLLLASRFDAAFQKGRKNNSVEAYNQLYGEARNLIGSKHLRVFDIKSEPDNVKEAYGDNKFGQGCWLVQGSKPVRSMVHLTKQAIVLMINQLLYPSSTRRSRLLRDYPSTKKSLPPTDALSKSEAMIRRSVNCSLSRRTARVVGIEDESPHP